MAADERLSGTMRQIPEGLTLEDVETMIADGEITPDSGLRLYLRVYARTTAARFDGLDSKITACKVAIDDSAVTKAQVDKNTDRIRLLMWFNGALFLSILGLTLKSVIA